MQLLQPGLLYDYIFLKILKFVNYVRYGYGRIFYAKANYLLRTASLYVIRQGRKHKTDNNIAAKSIFLDS